MKIDGAKNMHIHPRYLPYLSINKVKVKSRMYISGKKKYFVARNERFSQKKSQISLSFNEMRERGREQMRILLCRYDNRRIRSPEFLRVWGIFRLYYYISLVSLMNTIG